jgi:hypothetical protein
VAVPLIQQESVPDLTIPVLEIPNNETSSFTTQLEDISKDLKKETEEELKLWEGMQSTAGEVNLDMRTFPERLELQLSEGDACMSSVSGIMVEFFKGKATQLGISEY